MLTDAPYKHSLVHCNSAISSHVNEGQLAERDNPQVMGTRHNPLPFMDFISPIKAELDLAGWDITSQALVLSHQGDRLFGCYALLDRWTNESRKHYTPVLGFRASHDQAFARGLAPGTNAYVCDNRVFSSDFGVFRTKQTTFLLDRLNDMIATSVSTLRQYVRKTDRRFNILAATSTTDETAHDIIANTYRAGGVDAQGMARAVTEYHSPLDVWGMENEPQREGTAWGVLNALSSAAKCGNELTFRRRTAVIEDVVYTHYDI